MSLIAKALSDELSKLQNQINNAISDEGVDRAMTAYYPGEDWRSVFNSTLPRYKKEMRNAIRAALNLELETNLEDGETSDD